LAGLRGCAGLRCSHSHSRRRYRVAWTSPTPPWPSAVTGRDLRGLPDGALPSVEAEAPPDGRHLHDLYRASRALTFGRNASRRRSARVPTSRDSRCNRLSTVSPRPCPLPAGMTPPLRSGGSHRPISFRPRVSTPPRRLSPRSTSMGLLRPTSGPEVRLVFDFPLPPNGPLGPERVGGRRPPCAYTPRRIPLTRSRTVSPRPPAFMSLPFVAPSLTR
jgi:hypothetical protein